MNKTLFASLMLVSGAMLTACSDSDDKETAKSTPATFDPSEVYAGGQLGTVFNNTKSAFEQPSPAVDEQGFAHRFQMGEYLFERDFNQNPDGAFHGLGPVMVRNGCLYCHPAYGYGKRMDRYRATDMGNGYLLVIYDKQTEAYIRSVAGMPQTLAVAPFKAPVDETKINIEWKEYTDEWGNRFDDGETYSLIYPEVTIPADGFYSPIIVQRNGQDVQVDASEVGVKLESTIGIYGTGLLDAIPEDSIIEQYAREAKAGAIINPAMYKDGQYVGWYTNALSPGKKWVRRFTYALSRGPVLDAAGANAIWNITNVTRSDRRYHYLDLAGKYYAETSSKDPDVQKDFYSYFPEWNKTGDVEKDIYAYLTSREQKAEMSDDEYRNFMVWHRGLAVPAARNADSEEFQLGKQKFTEMGCTYCHRPSWTTGDDHIQDPNGMFTSDADMPRYPHQKIWPYTDMIQHKLHMVNDIRTGWCRTTPLWGRGLSPLIANHQDRLHDRRARNVIEAIMWHGASNSDARRSVEKFRSLNKTERDAVVKFINSI
ncbi:MAG: hypothetical protein K6B13_12915 [Prevotella sp.]|nr:hypothetical protein [Prevotella sp.]